MPNSLSDLHTLHAWEDNQITERCTQGEYAGKILQFKLVDKDGAINLSNCLVQYAVTRPDKTEDLLDCIVDNGVVKCNLTYSATSISGLVHGEVRVIGSNDSGIIKFYGVNLRVYKGVSDEAAEQSDEFTALIAALQKVVSITPDPDSENTYVVRLDDSIVPNGLNPVASGTIYDYLQGNYRQISFAHENNESSYDDGGVYIDDATDITKMYYVKNSNGAIVGILFCVRTPGYNYGTQVKIGAYGNITTRVKTQESGEADYTWKSWTPVGTTRNIQDGAVTTPKLAAGAVTEAKLAQSVISSIEHNNDDFFRLITSKNLFDKSTFTPGKELNWQGEIVDSATAGISTLIAIDSNRSVYFSISGSSLAAYTLFYVAEYDVNKSFISRIAANTAGYVYTPSASAKYIRLVIKSNSINYFQVEYDQITSYESYSDKTELFADNITEMNESINAKLPDTAESVGTDNLAAGAVTEAKLAQSVISSIEHNNDDFFRLITSKNLFDKSTFTPGKELNWQGEIVDSATAGISTLIAIDSNRSVYFSISGSSLAAYTLFYVAEYDVNKSFISRIAANTAGYVYTPSASAKYIRLVIKSNSINYFQVEYDQITSYESYSDKTELFADNIVSDGIYYLPNNPLSRVNDSPGLLSCFLHVGCIGDSLASGVAVYKDAQGQEVVNSKNRYEYSWGQYLARMTGNTYYNWSSGGLRTDTWLASNYATQCFDGEHLCQAYIIGLGQNDNNRDHGENVGTTADIDLSDYHNNADTFCGRYAKIIQKIFEVQPKAKIFVMTDPNDLVNENGYNTAIRSIAAIFRFVYVIDLQKNISSAPCNDLLAAQKRSGHYNAVGYYLIAKILMTYVDWLVQKNCNDFREIENIGTDMYYYDDLR